MADFRKQVVEITFLYDASNPNDWHSDLGLVIAQIDDGDRVGKVEIVSNEKLTEEQAAAVASECAGGDDPEKEGDDGTENHDTEDRNPNRNGVAAVVSP